MPDSSECCRIALHGDWLGHAAPRAGGRPATHSGRDGSDSCAPCTLMNSRVAMGSDVTEQGGYLGGGHLYLLSPIGRIV